MLCLFLCCTVLQVMCGKTHMEVQISFDRPFNGIIFSKAAVTDIGGPAIDETWEKLLLNCFLKRESQQVWTGHKMDFISYNFVKLFQKRSKKFDLNWDQVTILFHIKGLDTPQTILQVTKNAKVSQQEGINK